MKKYLSALFLSLPRTAVSVACLFALLLGAMPKSALAQTDNGCDGLRYKQDVFADVAKTTVTYTTTNNYFGNPIELKVDVYEPKNDAATQRPLIVLAHGGSFLTGDKSSMKTWCERLAKKGYVAASIQYRLYPVFVLGYPDSTKIMDAAFKAVSDMKAAIRFFRLDAAGGNQFKLDPDNFFLGGYSAGAVAALHASFIGPDDVIPTFIQNIVDANGGLEGNSGDAANLSQSSAVKLVLNMSGGLYRRHWVDSDDIPIISIHGTADNVVPYISGLAAGLAYLEGSGLLHPRAQEQNVPHYLETVTGGDHVNMYDSPQYAANVSSFVEHATTTMEAMICAGSSAAPDLALPAETWAVWPNPAPGAFAIRLPGSVLSARLRLFDALGKQVFVLENVRDRDLIHATNLSRGVFTMTLEDMETPGKRFEAKSIVLH